VLPPFSLPFQNEKEESCFAGEKKIIYKFVKLAFTKHFFYKKVEDCARGRKTSEGRERIETLRVSFFLSVTSWRREKYIVQWQLQLFHKSQSKTYIFFSHPCLLPHPPSKAALFI
jgi:hypothetical protein